MSKCKIKILSILVTVLLLAVSVPLISRAESDIQMIRVPFFAPGMWEMEWDFPYSDSFFLESSITFSRDIAKASMGLTASAFRKSGASTVPNQYETYLSGAGFKDLKAFGYDQPTTPHTLSGVIGSKTIQDFTLIAVSPCGQGYEKEWGGNLNVGDGERHAGFSEGAEILKNEIYAYIDDHHLTGKIKLWISSFSRGSAVSNLAAADLIASGRFEDVFAYLFGVPRTTKKDVNYANIINICGAYDPVTQVPLESWDYRRNGWDLYLPSAATDPNYTEKRARASLTCEAIANDVLRYDPKMDYQLHLILEFVGEMFPDSQSYKELLQDKIMGIWTEEKTDQIFQILSSVFSSLDDLNRRQEYSREVFLDYLLYMLTSTAQTTKDATYREDGWNPDQSLPANLFREHSFYGYMSWIFSDLTDEQLFNMGFSTQRLSVFGDVDVEIWQGDTFLSGMDHNGLPITKSGVTNENVSLFAERSGSATTVFLPFKSNYQVRLICDQPSSFSYRVDGCYIPSTYGTSDGYHFVAVTGGTYELTFTRLVQDPSPLTALKGQILNDSVRDHEYSTVLAMQLQLESGSNLIRTSSALVFMSVLLVLLLACLTIAIVHAVQKKKHGPYSPWYVIVPHYLFLLLFVWLTVYFTDTLYTVSQARLIPAVISGLILFLLALRGLIRNKNLPNLLITCSMPLIAVLNVLLYQRSEIVGRNLFVNLIYYACMALLAVVSTATFWIQKEPDKAQTVET
ncbi:MAG: hypothetical protein II710_05825 [Clostridia bacterium]|nr:hypothetical protein [Clostridia bacterium]